MGWFGRKRRDDGGYQDNAALSGFGGYEPSDGPRFPSAGYGPARPAPGTAEPRVDPRPGWASTGRAGSGPAAQGGADSAASGSGSAATGSGWATSDLTAVPPPPGSPPVADLPPGSSPVSDLPPPLPGGPSPAQPRNPAALRQTLTPAQLRSRRPTTGRGKAIKIVTGFALVGAFGYGIANGGREHSHRTYTPPPRTPSTYQPPPVVTVPAVVAGWQSVVSKDGSFAYDVPSSWKPAPGTVHGWEAAGSSPGVTLSVSAFLGEHSCKDDPVGQVGGAGVTTEKVADAAVAAREAVIDVGVAAYTGKGAPPAKVAPGAPEQTEVKIGTKTGQGSLVIAEVTPSGDVACKPQSVLTGAIALSAGDASTVLVVYSEQGRPTSASRDDLVRILKSYRGVPAADRSTSTPPPTTR
ncbi:hypothetical protein [Amycolatopsis benzoatilytica]|uniref:hypothetical protein n=1 Tax=Amycolatopsis benzoatilytica TaxID=346045 RepID=UPI00037AC956|nr:hypothetical protein [Amycolatopsis benzoatilytica]